MSLKNEWRVVIANSAEKQLDRVPHKDAERIALAIETLFEDPFTGDIVKLAGEENQWRRRIGSYRLFFEIIHDERTVLVQNIQRRGSKTY
jgi:mRNA interferase RelE/StbE